MFVGLRICYLQRQKYAYLKVVEAMNVPKFVVVEVKNKTRTCDQHMIKKRRKSKILRNVVVDYLQFINLM